jgi:uncharacterized protein
MAEPAWRAVTGGVEVRVRVTPRSGRDALDGCETLSDGRAVVKIRVRALPEDGAANEAVRRVLAKALGAAASDVTLKAGATARVKTFLVESDPALLIGRLGQLAGAAAA